ncbi:hypothetical protein AB0O08_11995 [Streptomyces anulatus]|uniref:hypothetical protein n=1 Tax=Streptomyces anulatus TaxID=1892 RepID=UPI0034283938
MTASHSAAALGALLDDAPAWLPPVDHWEVAREKDGTWIVQGQLSADGDTLTESAAYKALVPIVEQSGQALDDDGRLVSARFRHLDVPMSVWYLRPVLRWVVPEHCATCPTELGSPDVKFVRLGDGTRTAPVICLPCRDLMQAAWVTRICPAAAWDDHHWWFSLPDDGWKCTYCATVRTDPRDASTTTRAPRVEGGAQ